MKVQMHKPGLAQSSVIQKGYWITLAETIVKQMRNQSVPACFWQSQTITSSSRDAMQSPAVMTIITRHQTSLQILEARVVPPCHPAPCFPPARCDSQCMALQSLPALIDICKIKAICVSDATLQLPAPSASCGMMCNGLRTAEKLTLDMRLIII